MSLFSLPLTCIRIPYNSERRSSQVFIIRQNVATASQSPWGPGIPASITASTQTLGLITFTLTKPLWFFMASPPLPLPVSLFSLWNAQSLLHTSNWMELSSVSCCQELLNKICSHSIVSMAIVMEKRSWFSRVHSQVRGRGSHVIAEDTDFKGHLQYRKHSHSSCPEWLCELYTPGSTEYT